MEAPAKALDLGEALRRLANIVRPGTVAEVDLDAARARVQFGEDPDGDPVLTGWLPWITAAAGEDRAWRPPSVGEQVLLLAPYGELAAGWILPGAYRDSAAAPESSGAKHAMLYRDGALVAYDAAAHTLSAVLPAGGKASIEAPGGLAIAGDTEVDGDLSVGGDLSATGDISAAGDISDKNGSMQEMRNKYNAHIHVVFRTPTDPLAPNQRMT